MDLSRRDFIKLAALAPVVSVACGIPEKELEVQSLADFPEDLVKGKDAWFATQCGSCPDGCGVIVRVIEGRAKKIEGNLDYPQNRGKHLARCEASLQATYHPDRIKTPLKRKAGSTRGTNEFVPIGWDEAIAHVQRNIRNTQGQTAIMTNPLRGHLGLVVKEFASLTKSRHISYEEMDRVVVRKAIRDVFGQERLPKFDIANANTVLSFGADFLGTWFSPVSMGHDYAGFRGSTGKDRGYFIHVEPRMSQTAANADWWIPIKPGNEGLLAKSIAYVIINEQLGDELYTNLLTHNLGVTALGEEFAPENVVGRLGIPELRGKQPSQVIREIANMITSAGPSVILGGGSTAAHTNGLESLQTIYSLNYLTGSVGKEGGVILNPSSPLPEVPDSASGASYEEWKDVVDQTRRGEINSLIVHGIDPMYAFGESLGFSSALTDNVSLVSVTNFLDDTALMADIILPEASSLESWSTDIPDPAPGYQVVGIQQPVLNPPADANLIGNFGDVLLKVADSISKGSMPWDSMQKVVESGFSELFDLNRGSIKAATPSGFWQGALQRGGWWDINAESKMSNATPMPLPEISDPQFDGSGSFYLIPVSGVGIGSGDLAHLPWLQALPDPMTTVAWSTWMEINDKEAEEMGIAEGDVIELKSSRGTIKVTAYLSPAAAPKVLGVIKGQGHKDYGRYAKERGSNLEEILAPLTDRSTGAHAWASTRVTINKTGESVEIPRYEGTQLAVDPSLELHGIRKVVKITKGHKH